MRQAFLRRVRAHATFWTYVVGAFLALLVMGAVFVGWRHSRLSRQLVPPAELSRAPKEVRLRIENALQSLPWISSPVPVLREVAQLYFSNGFLEESISAFSLLETMEPKEGRWPYLRGCALSLAGEGSSALPALSKAVQLAPGYLPARLTWAETLRKSGRADTAGQVLRETETLWSQHREVQRAFAEHEISTEQWREAQARLMTRLRDDRQWRDGWNLLAQVHRGLGLPPPPEGAAEASLPGRGDPWVDEKWGLCFDPYLLAVKAAQAHKEGAVDFAETLYRRSVEVDPTRAASFRMLGTFFLREHRALDAIPPLRRAIELEPEESGNWTRLLLAQKTSGDAAAAAVTLKEGLARFPNSPGLLLEAGLQAFAAGKVERAREYFLKSRDLRPDEPQAYLELARVAFHENKIVEGLRVYEELLARSPGHPLAQLALCHAAIERADFKEATTRWKEVEANLNVPADERERLRTRYQAVFSKQKSDRSSASGK